MRAAIFFIALSALMSPAEAELAFVYTAEALVVEADVVFTGEVVSFSPTPDQDSDHQIPFRIKVHRRLYGPHDKGDIITAYGPGDIDVAHWNKQVDSHTPGLFFIRRSPVRRGILQGRYLLICPVHKIAAFMQTAPPTSIYKKDGTHIADFTELLRLTELEAASRLANEGKRMVARRVSIDAPYTSPAYTENYNRSMVRLYIAEHLNSRRLDCGTESNFLWLPMRRVGSNVRSCREA